MTRGPASWGLALLLLAGAALAEPPPSATTLRQQAKRLFSQRDYRGAGQAFEAAFDQNGFPGELHNAGVAYQTGKHYAEAMQALTRFVALRERAGKRSGRAMKDARRRIRKLRKHLLSTRSAVVFVVRPEAASVRLDGEAVVPGREYWLVPGSHVVEVSYSGHVSVRKKLDAIVGRSLTHTFALAAVPGMGRLLVEVTPTDAEVLVEGSSRGVGPLDASMPAGTVSVQVRKAGFEPHVQDAEVIAGKRTRLEITLAAMQPGPVADQVSDRATPVYETWWFWTTVGVVVAGGVTAAVLLTQDPGTTGPSTAEHGTWSLVP